MERLAWLPIHPDLSAAMRAARAESDPMRRWARLADLAAFRRDFVATDKLDRLMRESTPKVESIVGFTTSRLAILASHTVDHLAPAIRVASVARRLILSVHVADYGLYRQLLLERDPKLARFAPQFILLSLDLYERPLECPIDASQSDAAAGIDQRVEELRQLWRCAREHYGAQVVQQTFMPPMLPVFGSYEGLVPGSPFTLAEGLNAALRSAAREEGVLVLDLAWLGARQFHENDIADPVRWHQAKQLVGPAGAPVYGDLVARIIAAAMGLSRKCLVLDLDNTLWGGIIGDDGLDGIKLGQGEPAGEAHLAFQRYVAALGRRGIVLAVCSKNDAKIAESAFSDHPEMVLRREDIASFVANWDDKATNLRRVAAELNLGLDSLVFVDDNPAERDIIRRELPMVAVPELPDDVADYPSCLANAGYFEAATFTADDVNRNRSYRTNVERQAALSGTTDMEGYLKSLSMSMLASRIGDIDLPRAAQLINKSNQFNLTTRRYTEAELARLVADPETLSYCFRLRDRFGDNGLISVILARSDPGWGDEDLLIDTWLMSCRVLGRQVEAAALQVVAEEARKRGARSLIGEYRPTARNGLVAEHYPKLGFQPITVNGSEQNGSTFWRLDIGTASMPQHFIKLESKA